jgi:hypothetical protein
VVAGGHRGVLIDARVGGIVVKVEDDVLVSAELDAAVVDDPGGNSF